MKKLLLLFVFVMVSVCGLKSQEWFPPGASWYYNQVILLVGETYVHFEVTGEITIQGKNCKIVSGSCSCAAPGAGGYFYQEGDKVYAYNAEVDTFSLFYDFSLVAGDIITFKGDSLFGGDGRFLIDSVTTMQFGSQSRRVQHLTPLNPYIGWGNKIIEGIGSNGCMYPQVTVCDPATGGLRCYEDLELGLINFQNPPRSCTYITSAVDDPSITPVVKLYPNPASDMIRVESDKPIHQLTLFNNLGIVVQQVSTIDQSTYDMEVHSIPPGVYRLQIIVGDSEVVYREVVVGR